ncbi:DUF1289 domain-containing protein [Pseudophaeobacter profundi]|uniref:DUF1289 domain-containing protein n=1 Tax=Pseudophaeobacter profundi TaxID=3034152 RepID=UPI00242A94AE|nr:DUF1289 domain-containing protein [Pseudophaeobacter profundi]
MVEENGKNVWQRDEIQSPCINICVVHPEARICTGCYRSIEEITKWSKLSVSARAAVMADLPNRASLLNKRRGGRAARLKR